MLQVCCLNRLSLFMLRRPMGGFAFRLPCGLCQLYMWVQMGGALVGGPVCTGIGPFPERGLDEAFHCPAGNCEAPPRGALPLVRGV